MINRSLINRVFYSIRNLAGIFGLASFFQDVLFVSHAAEWIVNKSGIIFVFLGKITTAIGLLVGLYRDAVYPLFSILPFHVPGMLIDVAFILLLSRSISRLFFRKDINSVEGYFIELQSKWINETKSKHHEHLSLNIVDTWKYSFTKEGQDNVKSIYNSLLSNVISNKEINTLLSKQRWVLTFNRAIIAVFSILIALIIMVIDLFYRTHLVSP